MIFGVTGTRDGATAPQLAAEELRSGTWAAVRYAKRVRKGVVLFLPDGTVRGLT